MPAVPTFILRKLYVPGSLRNTDQGCRLQVKNTLAAGTISAIAPLVLDGVAQKPSAVEFSRDGEARSAADVSPARPFAFKLNSVVTITLHGVTLPPGTHRLDIDVTTREAGRLKFDVSDTIA